MKRLKQIIIAYVAQKAIRVVARKLNRRNARP